MEKKETSREIRKEKAIQKGLIVGEDMTLYRKVYNLYQVGFEYIMNQAVDFATIDQMIEASHCYFAPSQTATEIHVSRLPSHYFYCLNTYYIENLEEKDISVLKQKTAVDREVLDIIERTYPQVLTKDDAIKITYGTAIPENMVPNGAVALAFYYGKNSTDLEKELYIKNSVNQKKVIEQLSDKIEKAIQDKLHLASKVIVRKVV